MAEVERTLAIGAGLLMVISFAIWASLLRGPLLQRLDGRRGSNVAPAGLAVKFLLVAFVASAIAAALAITEWISP